ncbi:hypothetical protein H8S90_13130 [Olivibacter sp. SDN3]|uniref:hypothetical protein n=1 Tax=Olivibacter sp. SDN3 TaxID=2764720 RepID=UPI001651213C|nr:hypothetical protein [Olivibacter sp. SDN3]QNL47766.1 hypothetical protein H8S90_13130 [Olivibacter sp. SDN3]
MLLKHEKQSQRIVLDHLAPSDPKLEGDFKFYGPDMSYDAWEIKHNRLKSKEDLPLRNAPSTKDEATNETHPLKKPEPIIDNRTTLN